MTTGRPTDYSLELAMEMCDVISGSHLGVENLCKKNDNWPAPANFFKWLIKHSEFRELYIKAKKCQIEVLIEDVLHCVNDETHDFYPTKDGVSINYAYLARLKHKVDTVKWLATKLKPRAYGDKIQVEKVDPGKDTDLLIAKEIAGMIKANDNGRSSSSES